MHREVTTAYSVAEFDELVRQGFTPVVRGMRAEMVVNRQPAIHGGAEYPSGAKMQRHIKE